MTLDPLVLALIVAMGVLTYLTRIGGVWLAGRVARPERLETWLEPVPGAILTAFVAPAVLAAGWRGLLAIGVVLLVMTRTGNLLLAAALGTGLIALLRW
jgi:branched chain amino acid efflux pump